MEGGRTLTALGSPSKVFCMHAGNHLLQHPLYFVYKQREYGLHLCDSLLRERRGREGGGTSYIIKL